MIITITTHQQAGAACVRQAPQSKNLRFCIHFLSAFFPQYLPFFRFNRGQANTHTTTGRSRLHWVCLSERSFRLCLGHQQNRFIIFDCSYMQFDDPLCFAPIYISVHDDDADIQRMEAEYMHVKDRRQRTARSHLFNSSPEIAWLHKRN